MSLSTDFINSPQNFIINHSILIPGGTTAPHAGNGNFQFNANGVNSALLQSSAPGTNIAGYYARPVPNNNNVFPLPTQQQNDYFMFTDAMNGCQFIAYGPDRQHVTVEHNNFIGNPAAYALRLAAIVAQGHTYFFHLTAGAAPFNVAQGNYDLLTGLNIIGRYTQQYGWTFWVRDRLDQNIGNLVGPF